MNTIPVVLAGFLNQNVSTCSVRFDFYTELQAKLQTPAKVVPVFDKVKMQGERGAAATVDMPQGLLPHCCAITSLAAKPEKSFHSHSKATWKSAAPRRSP